MEWGELYSCFVKQNYKQPNGMISGLSNNRDTGLDLGIGASHIGTDGGHCGLSCNSNIGEV